MRRLILLSCVAMVSPFGARAAPADPSASAVLQQVGFGSDDRAQVLAGSFVHRSLEPATPRDLGIAMAFLVRRPPSTLDRDIMEKGLFVRRDPDTIAMGDLSGQESVAACEALVLSPAEQRLYRAAAPGEAINLSAEEIQKLASAEPGATALQRLVCELLFERYRAYRDRGLAGIAAYARSAGGETSVAADLRRISAAGPLGFLDAPLHRFLLDFPQDPPAELTQRFRWTHYRARGEPTLILTHALARPLAKGFVLVQRQYYVNRGFNVEQAVASLLAVAEGTLVVYTNHTTTDQLDGLWGAAKRTIGEKLMVERLQTLFGRMRAAVAK